jgi:hypothetical protein
MAEVNKKKRLCKATPSTKMVTNWVDQAKKMAPMVTY